MIHRIEITDKIPSARTRLIEKKIKKLGRGKFKWLTLVDVYNLDKDFKKKELIIIAQSLMNPVTQIYSIDQPVLNRRFDWSIEIGFLPAITDNVANTAKEIIQDRLKTNFKPEEGVYSGQLLLIRGNFIKEEIIKVANFLTNPLIQKVYIESGRRSKTCRQAERTVPKVKVVGRPKTDTIDLNVSDQELVKIGQEGIVNGDGTRRGPLALDLKSLKAIRTYFNKLARQPTDIELESIAQTWSEHCKHTIFNSPIDGGKKGLFKTYIKAATEKKISQKKGRKDISVSVFTDNSGAIGFNDQYLITHKVETHNSPSALDPFGGAVTGIVGVNRDTIGFGLGAKPIINTYGFCFAPPKNKQIFYRKKPPAQPLLSPRRILDGVVRGVNTGGNCSGIPTPQGFLYFNDRYRGKPLVFVGTLGLIPRKINHHPSHLKQAGPGDYIVMVGGRVGLDGVHGATFSSESLSANSPAAAVQIGDPITQKKLSDALVKEARDLGLYTSITDNGAGGLSSSVAEMAKESDGCLVNLEKVPVKYQNLSPWQIWISESQERMTLAVPKNKWPKLAALLKNRGVEATVIGQFTNSGRCLVKYKNQTVMDIELNFLHEGLPQRLLKTKPPKHNYQASILPPPDTNSLNDILLKMIGRLNVAGFEFISSQYDYEVQASSVIKPLQGRGRVNGEATVVRPLLNSQKGVVVSQGLFPSYSEIDSYRMAACCIDTAVRNVVSAGADPDRIALLDNFCWCSADDPERLFQLKKAAQACFDFAVAFGTPFISGKDSMFNDFQGYDKNGRPVKISIPPTLLISSVGLIDDVYRSVTIDLKFPGDLLYVLGETNDELAGSEYCAMMDRLGRVVPKVNALVNKKIYHNLYRAINRNLISSAIPIGRGGLGTALVKTSLAGMIGVQVSLENLPGESTRDDFMLFSESQGRILVSVSPAQQKPFEKIMKNCPNTLIGYVVDNGRIIVNDKRKKEIIDLKIGTVLEKYRSTFKNF